MKMQNRRFLRVGIPKLRAHFNVLPPGGGLPLFVGFGKRSNPKGVDETGEDHSFQGSVVTALNRIEAKLDRVIGYVERGGGKPYRFQAEVFDISGGGLALRSDDVQPIGAVLDLCIFPEYGDPQPVFAIGRICSVREERDEADTPVEIMGLEFIEIAEEDRDAIVRLVFQAERRQKRQAAKMDWGY